MTNIAVDCAGQFDLLHVFGIAVVAAAVDESKTGVSHVCRKCLMRNCASALAENKCKLAQLH